MGKKEKFKKVLKKGFEGAKKGYQEASKVMMTYGPGLHRGMGRVAESIQSGMAVSPMIYDTRGKMIMKKRMPVKQDIYYKIPKMKKIKKEAKGKMVRVSRKVSKDVSRAQVNFSNLSIGVR
jgi:hypothetical protein